ncbi:RICIN domain-containing protein [Streptomyces sp. NBC_01537]|uniref:RICIN domain-containing protein n=1 Tax=Streptomyces sp. NBC_01537 TaxID=2903896 RepID=UPI003867CCB3
MFRPLMRNGHVPDLCQLAPPRSEHGHAHSHSVADRRGGCPRARRRCHHRCHTARDRGPAPDPSACFCQLFTFQSAGGGAWTIKNVNSNLNLDIRDGTTTAGAAVIQNTPSTANSQKWTLTDAGREQWPQHRRRPVLHQQRRPRHPVERPGRRGPTLEDHLHQLTVTKSRRGECERRPAG